MFDLYKIGSFTQNYKYRRKGQASLKRYPRYDSLYYQTTLTELKKILSLIYQFHLLSLINDEPPPDPEEKDLFPTPSPPTPIPEPEYALFLEFVSSFDVNHHELQFLL